MKILLSVDDDPALGGILGALDWSIDLASWSEVLALHVIPQNPLFAASSDPARVRAGERLMTRVGEELSHLPVRVTRVLAKGDPAQEIVRMADNTEAELIVIGAFRARREVLKGSVSQRVVSLAPTDVLVVRDREGGAGDRERRESFRALLAVDGSDGCEAGIDAFCRKLRARAASIRVVHVLEASEGLWEAGREPSSLGEKAIEVLAWAKESLGRRGLQAEAEWRRGNPAAQIVEAARESATDVIVMGSQGRPAILDIVLGGITHRVLRHAHCSVFCARGWVSSSGALSRRWLSEEWEPGAGLA